jgi:hypothetical protein
VDDRIEETKPEDVGKDAEPPPRSPPMLDEEVGSRFVPYVTRDEIDAVIDLKSPTVHYWYRRGDLTIEAIIEDGNTLIIAKLCRSPGSPFWVILPPPPKVVTGSEAIRFCLARGHQPPDWLFSSDASTEPSKTPTPQKRKGSRKPKPPRPTTLAELAAAVRAKSPRSRNVASFLELIDLSIKPEDAGESAFLPVTIHFDDIREKCHAGGDVDDDTVERKTLIPARRQIMKARLPYRFNKSGSCAVVQRIPPEPSSET